MLRAARFPGALPQIWKVPARNPHFTGRGPDLGKLAHAATRLNNLAQILRDLGQPEGARPRQERALAIDEALRSAKFRADP